MRVVHGVVVWGDFELFNLLLYPHYFDFLLNSFELDNSLVFESIKKWTPKNPCQPKAWN